MRKLLSSLNEQHVQMLDEVIKRQYPKIRNYTEAIRALIEHNNGLVKQ
jgi:hypothetical protein